MFQLVQHLEIMRSAASTPPDTPSFNTWEKDELAQWATHAYLTIQQNQNELQDLRLKIASVIDDMQGVRKLIASVVDPL